MRKFVFIFVNGLMVTDHKEGLDLVPSFLVEAHGLSDAIVLLARYCSQYGDYSNDPEDYHRDIDDGNIEVTMPVAVE